MGEIPIDNWTFALENTAVIQKYMCTCVHIRMPYAYVYIHNMYVSCICKIRKIHVFTCIYVCFICGNYLSIQHTHLVNSQEHEVTVSTIP